VDASEAVMPIMKARLRMSAVRVMECQMALLEQKLALSKAKMEHRALCRLTDVRFHFLGFSSALLTLPRYTPGSWSWKSLPRHSPGS
jgi:hypothetical protein